MNVSRHDEFPIRQEAEEVTLAEGRKGFMQEDTYGNTSIYYYDRGKIVTVSGLLTESEAMELAESLPAVSASEFPKP